MATDPGGIPEEDTGLPVGTRLGKYEVVRALGAGGMGAVYEAVHAEIGKRVAVKVLNPSVAAVPGARTRFLREAQLTSRVRHPHIVDVTDMGSEGGWTFLVMELLAGEDLSERLGRLGPMPIADLVDVMLPVCSAVMAAHRAGITHRDLKPQNIFLADGPYGVEPKVLDFGISKGDDGLKTNALTGTGAMIGTPYYLAPEQIMDNRSAGPASDQYALGVILYECLTGLRPFDADNLFVVFQAIVAGSPALPSRRRPDLPPGLEEIVMRAMNVDPRLRFASVEELARALMPYASDRARVLWQDAFTGDLPPPSVIRTPGPVVGGPILPTQPVPHIALTTPLPPSAYTPPPAEVGGAMVPPLTATTPIPPQPVPQPVSTAPATGRASAGASGRAGASDLPMVAVPSGTRVMTPSAQKAATPRPPPRRSHSSVRDFDPADTGFGAVDVDLRRPSAGKKIAVALAVAAVVLGVGLVGLQMFGPDSAPPKKKTPAARPTIAIRDPGALPDPGAANTNNVPVVAPPVETFQVSVTVEPPSAKLELDGAPAEIGKLEKALPVDHGRHTLRISAEGYETRTLEFVDSPPPSRITLPEQGGARASREPSGRSRSRSGGRGRGGGRSERADRDDRTRVPPPPPQQQQAQPQPPPVRSLNPNGAPVID